MLQEIGPENDLNLNCDWRNKVCILQCSATGLLGPAGQTYIFCEPCQSSGLVSRYIWAIQILVYQQKYGLGEYI